MATIERLDGFTADGFGNVISGQPQNGDVIRVGGTVERRYYAEPSPTKAPDVAGFKAITRAKAKVLIKAGKHAEALTLLKSIGE
jgi:hypothetical protein